MKVVVEFYRTRDADVAHAVLGQVADDAVRGSIHDVARKAYSKSRRTSYTLTAADFR